MHSFGSFFKLDEMDEMDLGSVLGSLPLIRFAHSGAEPTARAGADS
tara:strand:+ start:317 stop:454 length:138 start_codon:yes stop_codon:yes gene_type:complete